jgi:hypothetical protein
LRPFKLQALFYCLGYIPVLSLFCPCFKFPLSFPALPSLVRSCSIWGTSNPLSIGVIRLITQIAHTLPNLPNVSQDYI